MSNYMIPSGSSPQAEKQQLIASFETLSKEWPNYLLLLCLPYQSGHNSHRGRELRGLYAPISSTSNPPHSLKAQWCHCQYPFSHVDTTHLSLLPPLCGSEFIKLPLVGPVLSIQDTGESNRLIPFMTILPSVDTLSVNTNERVHGFRVVFLT